MTEPSWFDSALADPISRSVALAAALAAAPPGTVREQAIQELGPRDAPLVGVTVMRREQPDDLVLALLTHPVAEVRAATAVQFRGEHGLHRSDLPSDWLPAWREAMLSATPHGYGEYELASALVELAAEDPTTVEEWYLRQFEGASGSSAWQVLGHELHRPLRHLPQTNRLSLLRRLQGKVWTAGLFAEMAAGDAEFVAEAVDQGVVTKTQALHALEDIDHATFERIGPVLVDRGVPPLAVAESLDQGYVGALSQHYADLVTYCQDLASRDDPLLAAIGSAGTPMFQIERDQALAAEHQARVTGTI